MTTTIANVIDRVYRDYLQPPDKQPARFKVGSGGITSSATTLPVSTTFLTAEEADAIGVGRLIESQESELMLIEGVTGDPPTSLTVRRAMYDTTGVALVENDFLYLAGEGHEPRQAIFEAVADAVTGLWPRLFQVGVEETFVTSDPIELPDDCADVFSVEYASGSQYRRLRSYDFKRNFPHYSSGRALQIRNLQLGTLIHVYYRRQATRPTAETDDISDLYIDESWVKPIVVGAAAHAITNRDLDQAVIDFITEALEAQGFKIGEGTDIRNGLLQFQDYLIGKIADGLALEIDEVALHSRSYGS